MTTAQLQSGVPVNQINVSPEAQMQAKKIGDNLFDTSGRGEMFVRELYFRYYIQGVEKLGILSIRAGKIAPNTFVEGQLTYNRISSLGLEIDLKKHIFIGQKEFLFNLALSVHDDEIGPLWSPQGDAVAAFFQSYGIQQAKNGSVNGVNFRDAELTTSLSWQNDLGGHTTALILGTRDRNNYIIFDAKSKLKFVNISANIAYESFDHTYFLSNGKDGHEVRFKLSVMVPLLPEQLQKYHLILSTVGDFSLLRGQNTADSSGPNWKHGYQVVSFGINLFYQLNQILESLLKHPVHPAVSVGIVAVGSLTSYDDKNPLQGKITPAIAGIVSVQYQKSHKVSSEQKKKIEELAEMERLSNWKYVDAERK